MSFWDDLLTYGAPVVGAIGGGLIGSAFGNPVAGAMLGGSLGGKLGQLAHPGDDGIQDLAEERKKLWDNLSYVGPPPGQGLTPQDMAAFAKARSRTEETAHSREQALLDRAQMSNGATRGNTLAAQLGATQGAYERGNQGDLEIASTAAARDAANRKALNDFNFNNTMMKERGLGNLQDLAERRQSRDAQQLSGIYSDIGAAGMYAMGAGKQGPSYGGGFPGKDAARYADQRSGAMQKLNDYMGPSPAEFDTSAGVDAAPARASREVYDPNFDGMPASGVVRPRSSWDAMSSVTPTFYQR